MLLTDLKAAVEHLKVLSPGAVEVSIRCTDGKSLRPAEVIREIFQPGEEALKQARILKIRSEYGFPLTFPETAQGESNRCSGS